MNIKDSLGGWTRLLAFLAAVGGLVLGHLPAHAQEKSIGGTADDFKLVDVKTGDPFQLSDLEGSIVVLDFFSYW